MDRGGERIFVTPALRDRGLGRLIMVEFEAKARELGYERIFLETGDRQVEALEMYSRLGCRRIPCHGSKRWRD